MPLLLSAGQRLSRMAALLIGMAVLSSASLPAAEVTADPFAVNAVQEDIRDVNPTVARERALLDAQRDALKLLLQRMTAPADWSRLPPQSDSELQQLVLDVGVDQEKSSAVRYLATLSVHFKAEPIRRLLRNASIPYAEWRGRPVVVVPLYQTDGGTAWDDGPNRWREAWKSGSAQDLVPLLVAPQGDSVTAPLAAGNADALTAQAQRFTSNDVVVVIAQVQPQDGGKVSLTVSVATNGPIASLLDGPARTYVGETGETTDILLHRAVADLAKALDDGWKTSNVLSFDHQGTLSVTVPLAGLGDWLLVRDKLYRSTPVRAYEVESLNKTEANLILHFVGDQAQLETIFVQNGLVLTSLDDRWTLRNTIAAPAAPPVDKP